VKNNVRNLFTLDFGMDKKAGTIQTIKTGYWQQFWMHFEQHQPTLLDKLIVCPKVQLYSLQAYCNTFNS